MAALRHAVVAWLRGEMLEPGAAALAAHFGLAPEALAEVVLSKALLDGEQLGCARASVRMHGRPSQACCCSHVQPQRVKRC